MYDLVAIVMALFFYKVGSNPFRSNWKENISLKITKYENRNKHFWQTVY